MWICVDAYGLSNMLDSSSIKSSHITHLFCHFAIFVLFHFTMCCIAFSIGSPSCENQMYFTLHTTQTHRTWKRDCDAIFGKVRTRILWCGTYKANANICINNENSKWFFCSSIVADASFRQRTLYALNGIKSCSAHTNALHTHMPFKSTQIVNKRLIVSSAQLYGIAKWC